MTWSMRHTSLQFKIHWEDGVLLFPSGETAQTSKSMAWHDFKGPGAGPKSAGLCPCSLLLLQSHHKTWRDIKARKDRTVKGCESCLTVFVFHCQSPATRKSSSWTISRCRPSFSMPPTPVLTQVKTLCLSLLPLHPTTKVSDYHAQKAKPNYPWIPHVQSEHLNLVLIKRLPVLPQPSCCQYLMTCLMRFKCRSWSGCVPHMTKPIETWKSGYHVIK